MLDRVGFFPTGRSSSGSNNPSIDKAPSLLLLLLLLAQREGEAEAPALVCTVDDDDTKNRRAVKTKATSDRVYSPCRASKGET